MTHKGTILFITKGDEQKGSSRYRAFQVIPRLKELGWDVSIGYICRTKQFPRNLWFYPSLFRTILMIIFKKVDLVYFQRADRKWRKTKYILKLCHRFNIKTVFDVDDEIDWHNNHSARTLLQQTEIAVVASHGLLADVKKIKPKNVYLLETPFDERLYMTKQSSDAAVLNCGFIGDGVVYFEGLQEVFVALNQLNEADKQKLHLFYLGDNIDKISGMAAEVLQDIKFTIIDNFDWSNEKKLVEILSTWHIGFVPRRIGAKGGSFKTIQYLALGIIPLAYDIGENQYFIEDGKNGFLIKDPIEWKTVIQQLLDNPNRRWELVQQGQIGVMNYSLENYCQKLDNILSNHLKTGEKND